jgi:dihydrofolate reductase
MDLRFQRLGILAEKLSNALKISIIVAKASNNVIGKDNELVWKLYADLKRFKKLTTGHCIIMGRKTYDSIGRPLPNRTSIVISRNPNFELPVGHFVAKSLEDAVQKAIGTGQDQVFVIGGAEIYQQSMDIADELIVTEVHAFPNGDAFFPEIDLTRWEKVSEENFLKDESNQYDFDFVVYKRKKS